tara:strand:- start:548 stop:697 length:150 start_codon:yes stop_codon:yes gene_type:complete
MSEFLGGFNGATWEAWAVALCFTALPVGFAIGMALETWKTRNECEGDSR